ncbi:efflux RND transporter periplasmic adaptor subunit [bacterium]|nr:efflux RND transporter periplasmic adaptor subunit [bacterium]
MRHAILILTLLAAGCSQAPTPGASSSESPSALKVVTEEVRKESFASQILLSGQVQPTEEKAVVLTAPLDGVAVKPLVKVGSLVVRDQPLVEMNSVYGMTSLQILEKLESEQDQVVEARAKLSAALTNQTEAQKALGQAHSQVSALTSDLRQAEADLNFAETDLKRKTELLDAGISSRAEVEESRTRYEKAKALNEAARQELQIARRQIPLFEKNIDQYQQAVELAMQAVKVTDSNFERNKAVYSQAALVGTEIPAELTSLALNTRHAQSSAAQASGFYVRAPITGVVTKLNVTSGQRVPSGAELGQVVELSQVYVDANAFEGDVARLREGDRIEVTSTSVPGQKFSGRIRYIGQQVSPSTRTIQVRSLIDNPKGYLRPDTFVDVSVQLPARADTVVISDKALLTLGNDEFVMVEDGKDNYRKQMVVVGAKSKDKVEILKGLRPGQRVVTEGNLLLESRER